MKLFLIGNSRAKKFKKNPAHWLACQDLLKAHPSKLLSSIDQLDDTLEDVFQRETDILMIAGGDGTLRTTLSRLLQLSNGRRIPDILPLPAGTINLVCSSFKMRKNIFIHLEKALRSRTQWNQKKIHLLKVNGQFGFVFGIGGFCTFVDEYQKTGKPNALTAFKMILSTFFHLATYTKTIEEFFPEFPLKIVSANSASNSEQKVFRAWGASVLKDIGLGFKPFIQGSEGTFSTLSLQGEFKKFFRSVPDLYRGRVTSSPFIDQKSHQHLKITCATAMPWMMDGDLLSHQMEFDLSLGQEITFVIPQ